MNSFALLLEYVGFVYSSFQFEYSIYHIFIRCVWLILFRSWKVSFFFFNYSGYFLGIVIQVDSYNLLDCEVYYSRILWLSEFPLRNQGLFWLPFLLCDLYIFFFFGHHNFFCFVLNITVLTTICNRVFPLFIFSSWCSVWFWHLYECIFP